MSLLKQLCLAAVLASASGAPLACAGLVVVPPALQGGRRGELVRRVHLPGEPISRCPRHPCWGDIPLGSLITGFSVRQTGGSRRSRPPTSPPPTSTCGSAGRRSPPGSLSNNFAANLGPDTVPARRRPADDCRRQLPGRGVAQRLRPGDHLCDAVHLHGRRPAADPLVHGLRPQRDLPGRPSGFRESRRQGPGTGRTAITPRSRPSPTTACATLIVGFDVQSVAVPEPSSLALAATGALSACQLPVASAGSSVSDRGLTLKQA